MSYTFDYFVGHLLCSNCGVVAAADESTNVQTKIGLYPAMASYSLGDFIDVDLNNIEANGYICIAKPVSPTIFSMVETWECPNCGFSPNWVAIEIHNGIVQSVQNVTLDEKLAGKANYITVDCKYSGWNVRHGMLFRED